MRRPGFLRPSEETDPPGFLDAAARTWQQRNAARHQRDLRVTEVTRQLGRMGLSARRLRGRELVQLYYSCLTPQRAARHPLSEQVLASAGAPVVAVDARERTAGSSPERQVGLDGSCGDALPGAPARPPAVPDAPSTVVAPSVAAPASSV